MNRILSVVIVLFAILQRVIFGSQIGCYQCMEEMNQNLACEVNVNSVLKQSCTEGFVCVKFILKDNTSSLLHRGCAPHSKCQELTHMATPTHVLELCSTCNSSLCNSVLTYYPSLTQSLLFIAFVQITSVIF